MRRHYKNPKYQAFYDRLRELGTPEALQEAHIFGTLLSRFRMGYNGFPPPCAMVRGTPGWVAYYAGKDAGKEKK